MTVLIDYTKGFFETTEGDTVGTVTAGTGTYNLAVASYDGVSFSVASQDNNPRSVTFNSDGSKMFVLGVTGYSVYQYSLSTAWNPSSATYDSVSFSVETQETSPITVVFKSDGTSFYIVGITNSTVYQYDLTTAYDLSTASYANKTLSTGLTNARGLSISTDGTKLWASNSSGIIQQFTMSTAWDVSTASSDSKSLDVSARGSSTSAIYVSPDGSAIYINNLGTNTVYKYDLSTNYDISTGTYSSVSFSLASEETVPWGFTFKNDGSKMYAIGNVTDTVYQYSTGTDTTLDLSTGSVFSYTPTANTTFAFSNPPASGTASSATLKLTGANVATGFDLSSASYDSVSYSYGSQGTGGEAIVFKPDGTKMFILNTGDVDEYTLSTAWDLSTVSYDSTYDPSEVSNALGLQFSYDGTKFYIADSTNDDIYQYNMTTAWDVSTASYANKSLDVSGQEQVVQGLDFKTDGTKLFIIGTDSDQVREYNLSTAWDISTASYVGGLGFSVSSQDTAPLAIRFNSDGTKFFILGYANDTVYQYSLSTAWDTSTASYDSVSFSIASQETFPRALGVKSDGTKMYIAGSIGHSIYQYSTSSSALATITYPSSVIWSGGTTPTAPANGETDVYTFYTDDGGTTYYGFQVGDAVA